MGNILCKNRTNKTGTSKTKSPVDRVIRNLQICPQGIGKKKYFWEKQILETSAAPSQVPKDEKNGWQDASLNVPSAKQNINDLDRPIPPPRKKKSHKLQNDEHIKNGFEDVFLGDKVNLKSKSLTNINNSNQNEKPNSQITKSLSKLNGNTSDGIETNNKTTSTSIPRKVSKVGNKKSDKFFGENLSDCLSDEIIPTANNNIEKIISAEHNHKNNSSGKNNESEEDNTLHIVNLNDEIEVAVDVGIEEDDLLRKINKERGKLMFSIEKQINQANGDDERYKGEIPVEEEIIVPVKKQYKHICDIDDELHDHLHLHNNSNDAAANGPRKPQRDFAKFKKPLYSNDKIVSSQIKNLPVIDNSKNIEKCNNETQTGIGGVKKNDNLESVKMINQVTEEAKLVINDILKSAEAAVENKTISKSEPANICEKATENVLKITAFSDEVKNNSSNTNLEEKSDENYNTIILSDLINPAIKINDSANILIDTNQNAKQDLSYINELEKSQPSIRPTRTSEIVPPNLSNSEKNLRRSLSTQSYLTSDLIEKIALQANILSMSDGSFSPEDVIQCNDGSGLVSPNFKLDQKRSLSPQISTINDKLDTEVKLEKKTESTEDLKNLASDVNKIVINNVIQLQEKISNDLKSSGNNITSTTTNTTTTKTSSENNTENKIVPETTPEKRIIRTPKRQLSKENTFNVDKNQKKDVSEAIKTFLDNKDMKPQQILDLLQDEFGGYIFSKCLSPEDKLIIEDLEKSAQESKIIISPITPTGIKPSFKFSDKKHAKSPEKHKISKIPVLANKNVENISFNDKRRHSIDDLNAWFTPEKDFPLRKRKREASLPGSLDNAELFNGKVIHSYHTKKSILIEQDNEESAEKSANNLVDDIINKAEDEINNKNIEHTIVIKSIKDTNHFKDINGNSRIPQIVTASESDEDDHSALLKFLEHEKSNNL